MRTAIDLFREREKFHRFLENSTLQYVKLKFGNKENLVSFIQNNFGIRVPKTASYTKIFKILRENSKDFYKDVLGISSPIEIAHLYSFYKLLVDIFWETTWVKTFSPFYTFLFDKEINIRKKSELREYATEIITEFVQQELEEKWCEYTSTSPPIIFHGRVSPVIHYKHLTIGPLGFLFSLYYREKEIFGNYEPTFAILVDKTSTGKDIVDWERTDIFRVFSFMLKELDKKIDVVKSSYPIYGDYLISIGFEFPYHEWKKKLPNLVKLFKNQVRGEKIPEMFYQLVQFTAMFFKNEEVMSLLNKLIAENVLIINSETEIEDLKITKDGMIKRPRSWFARPAFELAIDIASIESKSREGFEEILTDILKNGAIKYLKQMFDNDFETFGLICAKRGLHRFTSLEKHLLSREGAIRLLLESYGLKTPPTLGLDIRKEIELFLKRIQKFEEEYINLEEPKLIRRIIDYLRDGRVHFERVLKEFLFIMIALILYYEGSISKGLFKDIFILDRPVFHIWYNVEQELERIRVKYNEFLERLASSRDLKIPKDMKPKIDNYIKKRKIGFTLGDWYSLLKLSTRYIDKNLSNEFWNALPNYFQRDINTSISEVEYFVEKGGLKWLNLASHEGATRELRENLKSRQEALSILPKLRRVILSVLQRLPELIIITEKVTEAKTGLEYYKAESSDEGILKIYGTRFVELQFLYYLIPRFEEESILTYPILITNLTDTVF